MKTPRLPRPSLPPLAVQEQIDPLLDGIAGCISQIAQELSRVAPSDMPAVIARHRSEFAQQMEALGNWIADYLARGPSPDDIRAAQAYVAAPLRAWSATSPLFYRILHTPSNRLDGFEIPELLLENRASGADPPAQILDYYYLNMVTVNAYRSRFWQLIHEIEAQVKCRAVGGAPVSILSLHTGSGPEMLHLARDRAFARSVELTCVDSDPAALRLVREKVSARLRRPVKTVFADPQTCGAASTRTNPPYDLIYAISLLDQIKDPRTAKLIQDCHGCLNPGGALILGNFAQSMPISERMIISWGTNWNIRCRSEEGVKRLFDHSPFGSANLLIRYDALQASMLIKATR